MSQQRTISRYLRATKSLRQKKLNRRLGRRYRKASQQLRKQGKILDQVPWKG